MLGVEAAILPPPLGSQPSWTAKTYLRMYARKNTGNGDAEQGGRHRQVVQPASIATGREVAERNSHSDGEDHRPHRQLERRRPQPQHLLGDRAPGVDAVPEVELHRRDEELAVLDVPRLVQPVESLDPALPVPPLPALPGGPRRALPGDCAAKRTTGARARTGSGPAAAAAGRRTAASSWVAQPKVTGAKLSLFSGPGT